MGLPDNWELIESWLSGPTPDLSAFPSSHKEVGLKCPEIPSLASYESHPDESFWDIFPNNPIPKMAESCISADALSFLIEKHRDKLKTCEVLRAKACIDSIRLGASSHQKTELPACHCKNAKSAVINGREVTDVLAVWLKKKFVAGPFKNPPFDKFRVNSLMAIDQGHKVRPVLNVSLPKLSSFNDNIDKLSLEKVKMSTAKKFSYTLVEAGVGAVMSTFDMVDAYKNIPAPLSDLRLQGFEWLSRYFG